MQTDILIPLGKGSRQGNLELRYSIRSIEKHITGVGNVFIVGELPEFVQNVIHIPCRDNPNNWNRARNIYSKIMAGIEYRKIESCEVPWGTFNDCTELSENFLFVNDDHYLLQDFEAGEFPYYNRGELDPAHSVNNNPQFKQMFNTSAVLGYPAYDFDIHCPIVYNKADFIKVFDGLDWPEYGYGIKSMYGNIHSKKGPLIDDLKFSEPLMKESIYQALEGRPWFSTGDRCLKSGGMKEVLQELYPDKSKYEK